MDNKLELVRCPDQMSGPRHGGPRKERRFKFYVNDVLFNEFVDDRQLPFNYASGAYLDRAIDDYIAKFERALKCECLRVDMSRPEPKPVEPAKAHCDH